MSQNSYTAVAAELEAAHLRGHEAYKHRDADAYMDLFDPTLTYKQIDGKVIDRYKLSCHVMDQLATVSSVETSSKRESLTVDGEQATEMMSQTASIEMVHFGVIRRKWSLVRRGRYVWKKIGGAWRIVEVEVLEEKVTHIGTRLGLR